MTQQQQLVAAQAYLDRGWLPVPIPLGEKAPRIKDWPDLRLERDDLPTHFAREGNIGIILGAPSKHLVDIDIDHVGAIDLAERYLPSTGRIFGRPGKPRSHWLYMSPGAETTKYPDPTDGEMLVELHRRREASARLGKILRRNDLRLAPLLPCDDLARGVAARREHGLRPDAALLSIHCSLVAPVAIHCAKEKAALFKASFRLPLPVPRSVTISSSIAAVMYG
jgi:hypothetical protein